VNGINSRLGFFALENIFKLKGDRKLSWYQELENNPAERGKFLGWLMREGMLHVKVWENDTWVERASMLDVGPGIAKDQIVLLDISGISGTTLKIKLEAATDLWRIDRVYADYTKDETVTSAELSPFGAINELGSDVRELLSNPDEQYYTTVPGQFANMTFKDLPRRPGFERSYVLKTRGFYYEWIDSKGPGQTELLERILNEPLYGSKVLMTEWMKNRGRYGEKLQ
jgi:hypothetical protein